MIACVEGDQSMGAQAGLIIRWGLARGWVRFPLPPPPDPVSP
jgi:hypothetical protein